MNERGYQQNCADPCLYYKWDDKFGLIVWLSLIDDMLIVCAEDTMECVKKKFTETVDCNYIGEMKEYIGTKINIDQHNKTLKIAQPVLVQSVNDEFILAEPNSKPETPATAGTHLMISGPKFCATAQPRYCSGIGKLRYLVKWL